MLRAAWRLIYRTVAVIAVVLLVELLGGCSSAPRKAPSFVALRGHIQSAQSDASNAKNAIAHAQSIAPKVPELSEALATAQRSIDSLTEHLLGADARVAELERQTNSLADQLNAALPAVGKYHKVKLILCAVAASAALFAVLSFHLGALLAFLGPYGVGIAYVGLPAAAAAFVWFRL